MRGIGFELSPKSLNSLKVMLQIVTMFPSVDRREVVSSVKLTLMR